MKQSKNNAQKAHKVNNTAKDTVNADVLGSYTGMSQDGDAPVQDADDL